MVSCAERGYVSPYCWSAVQMQPGHHIKSRMLSSQPSEREKQTRHPVRCLISEPAVARKHQATILHTEPTATRHGISPPIQHHQRLFHPTQILGIALRSSCNSHPPPLAWFPCSPDYDHGTQCKALSKGCTKGTNQRF